MKARDLEVGQRIVVSGRTVTVVGFPPRILPHVTMVDGAERSMWVDGEDESGTLHEMTFKPSDDVRLA